MSIPVLIVSGYLGGGKTTFLRYLLPLYGASGIRPALIINEAGTVDIDGQLLADLRAEQVSLLGGCICCSLQADLARTVEELIARQRWDAIIIECSGFSAPKEVLHALAPLCLHGTIAITHVISLIDAQRLQTARKVVNLVKEQVAAADWLIINKVDKLRQEHRTHLGALVKSMAAPDAQLFWTSYTDIGSNALLRLLTDPNPRYQVSPPAHEGPRGASDHHHALPAQFKTFALTLPMSISRATLDHFLQRLPANVLRAKGIVHLHPEGWQVVQRVFTTHEITPFLGKPNGTPSLVCIGTHLDIPALTTSAARVFAMDVPLQPFK